MPGRQRTGLVAVEAGMNGHGHLPHETGEVDAPGGMVDGVRAEDDEALHGSRFHVAGERRERVHVGGLGRHRRDVANRLPDRAERNIGGMG